MQWLRACFFSLSRFSLTFNDIDDLSTITRFCFGKATRHYACFPLSYQVITCDFITFLCILILHLLSKAYLLNYRTGLD
ncbi:hypothetical protein CW304_30440 [Bacillus sp. UFRGS-B20]|nr:hypothetical protein CW304_30440 [Bacillus sp. UFRGS-B20]